VRTVQIGRTNGRRTSDSPYASLRQTVLDRLGAAIGGLADARPHVTHNVGRTVFSSTSRHAGAIVRYKGAMLGGIGGRIGGAR
jgi:hypothetical protein